MKPSDLPEARADMIDYMLSEHGQRVWLTIAMQDGFMSEPATEDIAVNALKNEISRWNMAELFWVTEDMTHLASEASKTMPAYSLQPDDLPAPYGFMRFATPVGESLTNDPSRPALPIVGVLWGPITVEDAGGTLHRGVWLSYYTDSDEVEDEALRNLVGRDVTADQIHAMRRMRGPFVYDDEMVMTYGKGEVEEHWRNTHYVIRCAWLMMQQSVAAIAEEPLPRPNRRRLERRQASAKVRLVRLRHAASEGVPNGDGRDYHHRWVVRGHWRKQWYATQERHIPIWIAPHVKGPDGAPLLGGEKVYVWER